ncbi:hypothetical protein [Leucobacter ruminantium]|uniref:Scaffolding protein n=1 Tax=Leucobacter ruminantium TaxID=1289170 RepID=A0A939M2L0_9MICO|nr:hypothetical protein [Leucobacter ruminantium]MBO1805845.1 hypothetical protein [Leucobacter ruminantium]
MSLENQPANENPTGTEPADGGKSDYTPPATQADLDRIVESRLARERSKFADYDDLKKKAAEHDAYLESQKDEHQKALDKTKADTESAVAQRFLSKLVSTEVKAIAATLGFNDPSDALAVIDAEKLPVKDDEPDTEAIKAAVEKLAFDKPYLVKAGSARPATRPRPKPGERQESEPKKGRAAAALRQLGAARKSS